MAQHFSAGYRRRNVTDVIGTDPGSIQRAAACLRDGGLVAFPTETVYGLGVHALDVTAVRRLFAAKGRPASDPLIVHVGDVEQAATVAAALPPAATMLANAFWPGPLTLVLKRRPIVPSEVTAGLDTVAVRIPAHPVARALIAAAGVPVAAPSANLFSRPSPTTAAHVLHDLDGRIDMVIDGGATPVGVESTVVDLTVSPARLLRPGGIPIEQLRAVLSDVETATPRIAGNEAAPSPGLLSQHYSPRTPLALFTGPAASTTAAVATRIEEATARGLRVGVLATREQAAALGSVAAPIGDLGPGRDANAVARRLYAAIRELDAAGLDLILAQEPPGAGGLWRAVSDRLARAATEHVRVT
jgi:L-threonylcarbamoyladenylate synthase